MLSKPIIKRMIEKPAIKAKMFTILYLSKKNNTPNKIIILIR